MGELRGRGGLAGQWLPGRQSTTSQSVIEGARPQAGQLHSGKGTMCCGMAGWASHLPYSAAELQILPVCRVTARVVRAASGIV